MGAFADAVVERRGMTRAWTAPSGGVASVPFPSSSRRAPHRGHAVLRLDRTDKECGLWNARRWGENLVRTLCRELASCTRRSFSPHATPDDVLPLHARGGWRYFEDSEWKIVTRCPVTAVFCLIPTTAS